MKIKKQEMQHTPLTRYDGSCPTTSAIPIDVSSSLTLLNSALRPSTTKQSKFVPLPSIDTFSFLSLMGRLHKTLLSTDTVWISATLLSSATFTRTWRHPEAVWGPATDTSKSVRFCTFSSHCQSSQSGGMLSNVRERRELGCGKLCNAVGSEMVTVCRRGSELNTAVNFRGNVDVRRGLWISNILICNSIFFRKTSDTTQDSTVWMYVIFFGIRCFCCGVAIQIAWLPRHIICNFVLSSLKSFTIICVCVCVCAYVWVWGGGGVTVQALIFEHHGVWIHFIHWPAITIIMSLSFSFAKYTSTWKTQSLSRVYL